MILENVFWKKKWYDLAPSTEPAQSTNQNVQSQHAMEYGKKHFQCDYFFRGDFVLKRKKPQTSFKWNKN